MSQLASCPKRRRQSGHIPIEPCSFSYRLASASQRCWPPPLPPQRPLQHVFFIQCGFFVAYCACLLDPLCTPSMKLVSLQPGPDRCCRNLEGFADLSQHVLSSSFARCKLPGQPRRSWYAGINDNKIVTSKFGIHLSAAHVAGGSSLACLTKLPCTN